MTALFLILWLIRVVYVLRTGCQWKALPSE
jgi:transposase